VASDRTQMTGSYSVHPPVENKCRRGAFADLERTETLCATSTGTPQRRHSQGRQERGSTQRTVEPRLLDLEAVAAYLGVSPWTVRDLEFAGVLRRVRIPLPDGRELRKLLFDREDLDRLIEAWKDA